MSKKSKSNSADEFDQYYTSLYGARWPHLKESLLSERDSKIKIEGLLIDYFIDRASMIVAKSLNATPGDNLLDMCAAPGGKSLIIALSLNGQGSLTSNDISLSRRLRMLRVFDDALDKKKRDIIRVTSFDASNIGLFHKNGYDRILLDAPCSSEEHVLKNPKYLAEWSPSRIKRLSRQQYSMLSSAYLALKQGGRLIYSTCAINHDENEAVVERILQRHADIHEIKTEIPSFKRLPFGQIALPDKSGIGPIYFAILEKDPNTLLEHEEL